MFLPSFLPSFIHLQNWDKLVELLELFMTPFLVARFCSVTYSQSYVQISTSLTDMSGLLVVSASDLVNISLSVPWFVFVLNFRQ